MLETIIAHQRASGLFALTCAFTLIATPALGASHSPNGAANTISDTCIAALKEDMILAGEDPDEIADISSAEMRDAIEAFANDNDISGEEFCLIVESGVWDENTPAEGRVYPSIDHLRVAAIVAGVECPAPQVMETEGDINMQAVGCYDEDGNPLVLLLLFDEKARTEIVEAEKPTPMLIGPNWAVMVETVDDANDLQDTMGGEIVKP